MVQPLAPYSLQNSGRRRDLLRAFAWFAAGGFAPAWARASRYEYQIDAWPPTQPTPALEAVDLEGHAWRLGDLRGRAVLLNFWASDCRPCSAEMPELQNLAAIYGPSKLAVLTIADREPRAVVAGYVDASHLALPVLLDPNGELARQWGVKRLPTTVLIDAAGRPRQSVQGPMQWTGAMAQRLIAALLPH